MKPEIWDSEKLGKKSILARLNFKGLISLADDSGRGRGDMDFLRGRLHPYAKDVSSKRFIDAMKELDADNFVVFYKIADCSYYWLPGFTENQKIDHPSPSKFPEFVESSRTFGEASPVPREHSCLDSIKEGIKDSIREGKGGEAEIPEDLKPNQQEIKTWLAYKKEKNQTYKPLGLNALWKRLREIPESQRKAAIESSMAANYTGVFPAKGDQNGKTQSGNARTVPGKYAHLSK